VFDHVGLNVRAHATSRAFYERALVVLDPDGNNVEAVCHR
jgi:hypothetical protein